MIRPIVSRFAPSPTGYLHLGGLRTALFNFLLARSGPDGSRFVLRIEDTDQARYVEKSKENIMEMLDWVGIDVDEYYVQSERREIYNHYKEKILDSGNAYRCFCNRERLQQFKMKPYDRHCLHLSDAEVKQKMKRGDPHTIRFKIPDKYERIEFHDVVYGKQSVPRRQLDDPIIVKSDGMPTYHFANVIDDHLMEITHCLRGSEWLPSTPKHVLLYEALGWDPPSFAHLPLLAAESGEKLSKRHGHASVQYYKDKGYLPEALVNFIAFHGFMPTSESGTEIVNMKQLIDMFTLDHVKTQSKVVDLSTLNEMNATYLKDVIVKEPERIYNIVQPFLATHGYENVDSGLVKNILTIGKDRIHVLDNFVPRFEYFFKSPLDYGSVNPKFKQKVMNIPLLTQKSLFQDFKSINFDDPNVNSEIMAIATKYNMKKGDINRFLRFYLTANHVGPELFQTLKVMKSPWIHSQLQEAEKYMVSQHNGNC